MAGLDYESGVAAVDPDVAPRIVPVPDPLRVDAELAAGSAAIERYELPEGIRGFTRAVIHDPTRSEGFAGLSSVLAMAGQTAAAAAACRAALDRAPGDLVVRARFAVVLQVLGDFDGAGQAWREVLQVDDSHPDARGRLAVILYYLEYYDEAWAVIHEADARDQEIPAQLRVLLAEEIPEP